MFFTVFEGRDPNSLEENFDSTSQEDDGTLWKFNTSYHLNDDILVFFTYSEGFRLGAGNGIGLCPEDIPDNQFQCALPDEFEYVPDQTQNYELGLRSTWLDQRLTFNGALFYIEWIDHGISSVSCALDRFEI